MWLFKKNNKITNYKDLAEQLHICGLDAYSYPKGRGIRNLSAYDWNNFRQEIATELLNRFEIYKKPH